MQKVVNTKILKNNTFHQFRHSTTFGVAFHHPSGLTEIQRELTVDFQLPILLDVPLPPRQLTTRAVDIDNEHARYTMYRGYVFIK